MKKSGEVRDQQRIKDEPKKEEVIAFNPYDVLTDQ